MACTSPPAISVSSKEQFDVFISFRGVDTRRNFTCHLAEALEREGIRTFTDVRLETGDSITPALLKAIEESKLAVIIFSEVFASSWWCLEELVHITKCKWEQRIIPVFYGIEPSYARRLQGNFEAAFAEHRVSRPADKVEESRNALTKAANLSAIVSKSFRNDVKLIEKIVQDVLKKLNEMPYSTPDYSKLVGIEKHIEKLEPLLRIGSPDFRIIGIWGMIGVGKTTIADVLYHRICPRFEGFYFLQNVSEEAKLHGLVHLQNILLAGLLGETNLNLGHKSSGSTSIRGRLCQKRVLVVLDGVDDEDQFDQLLPREHIEFHPESRIIVTTRNVQVLKMIRASEEYRVNELDDPEALDLFNLYAFDNNFNKSDFADLSDKAVKQHAGRVPLALKIFGKCLRRHASREAWESELEKWEFVPNEDIQKTVKICYDSLHPTYRNIFLDIACFFRGEDRNFIERILHGCNFFPKVGISYLIDNCLLMSTHDNKISMHELLQRMAQEIVLEESERKPENRSRLWIAEDICEILEKSMGTAKLEGIFLDTANSKREKIMIPSTAFSNMSNLRLLKIHDSRSVEGCKVHIPRGLESLPNSLVYFHWHSFPLKSLPSTFAPNGLVELNMPYSKLENLWPTGVQHLGNLKRINFSYSEHLSQIPDLSRALNIESINLESCRSLLELPSYVSNLDKLTSLNLKGCSSLRYCYAFPRNIKSLDVRNCGKLQTLPNNVCDLEHLWHLNLSGCCRLENFPGISRPMKRLEYLKLNRTSIVELPRSIKNLLVLKVLSLNMCKNLQALPSSISSIYTLQELNLCHCSNLKSLPKLPASVSCVDARYCSLLESVSISKANLGNEGNKFVFYNCLKLDEDSRNNIMADAQLRILRSAMIAREDGESKTPEDEICFPGDKIPEWFEHQNDRYEINVELDHQGYWCNPNFLGFAFCVVVEFDDFSSDSDFQIHCKSECIFRDGKTNKWSRCWTWHWNYLEDQSTTMNSSHIFLFHDYCCKTYWNFPINCEASSSTCTLTTDYRNKSSATFSFHPEDSRGRVSSCNCQVLKCGVRLLYTHDLEKFRDVGNSPLEIRRMMSTEEGSYLAHAPNDFQRTPISCECLLCCFQLREICGLLGHVFRPVAGSVRSSVDPSYEEKLEKLQKDIINLHCGITNLQYGMFNLQSCINRMMAQHEQTLDKVTFGNQFLRQLEMNMHAPQTAR